MEATRPVTKNLSSFGVSNMLLSTTYDINRSASKRITVGLKNWNGMYKPVVKICSTGLKCVTFDADSWETFLCHTDVIASYLKNAYSFYDEFGKPTKIFLQNHDLAFVTAYGSRAINIEETPIKKPENMDTNESSNKENHQEEESQEQQVCKRRKYETAPNLTLQLTTFEGILQARECINAQLQHGIELSSVVNSIVEIFSEYVSKQMLNEKAEELKIILGDFLAFKKYCFLHKYHIENYVKSSVEISTPKLDVINILLPELFAYSLPIIAERVNKKLGVV